MNLQKLRHMLETSSCASFAAVVGYVSQRQTAGILLAVFPMIALGFTLGWGYMYLRTQQLAQYIRQIEAKYPVIGWGKFMKQYKEHEGRKRNPLLNRLLSPSLRFPFVAFGITSIASAMLYINWCTNGRFSSNISDWIVTSASILSCIAIPYCLFKDPKHPWNQTPTKVLIQESTNASAAVQIRADVSNQSSVK